MTYRLALADDQILFLESVRRFLVGEPEFEVIAEACDGKQLLEWLANTPIVPDMIITDISMPGVGGIEVTRQVKVLSPKTKVLILTMHEEEEYLAQSMQAGAEGYLLKDDAGQDLITAIRLIRAGTTYISPLLRPQFNFMTRAQNGTSHPGTDPSQTQSKNGMAKPAEDAGDKTRP